MQMQPTDEIQVRSACEACEGSGNAPEGERPYCGHCRREFDEVKLSDSIMDWGRLPCGHDRSALTYTPPECRACGGSGMVTRWVAVADLARAILAWAPEEIDNAIRAGTDARAI